MAVAASGVAALLLKGGRTAHSMLKMPITGLNEHSVCAVKAQSNRAELLRQTDIIIWDEAPMSNRLHLNAVDKSLQVGTLKPIYQFVNILLIITVLL